MVDEIEAAAAGAAKLNPDGETITIPEGSPPEPVAPALPEAVQSYLDETGLDLERLVSGHQGLLKLRGVPERDLVRIPRENASDEVKAAWREKVGAPEEPSGYGLADLMPESAKGDPLVQQFEEQFHELGLPKQAATRIVERFVAEQEKALAANDEQYVASVDKHISELESSNPKEYRAMLGALQKVGATDDEFQNAVYGSDPAAVLGLLMRLTASGAEQAVRGVSDGEAGAGDVSAAKARIAEILNDQRYHSRDPAVRQPLIDEIQRQHAIVRRAQQ